MAKIRCPRGCGATWNKGDKMAEIAHNVSCKKSVFKAGLYLPRSKK